MLNSVRQTTALRHALAPRLLLTALCSLFALPAGAQLLDIGTPTPRQLFTTQTPPVVLNGTATLVEHYDPNKMLRLAISLNLPHPVEEAQFIHNLYDKKSPLFHKYPSPEDWVARFGPSVQDEQTVVDWAKSQGLTITFRYPNRLVVDAEAPAGVIEKALHVTINSYRQQFSDGRPDEIHFSNDRDPVLPSDVDAIVHGVHGLNSFEHLYPAGDSRRYVPRPDYTPGPAIAAAESASADAQQPASASGLSAQASAPSQLGTPPSGYYQPTDIWSAGAYDYKALMDQGHCCNPNNNANNSPPESSIAIAAFGDLDLNDISLFHSTFPYLAYNISKINVDGGYGTCDNTEFAYDAHCFEVTLDSEWALATANSTNSAATTAKLFVYEAPDLVADQIDVYNQMLKDGHARVFTQSFACAELDGCISKTTMQDQDAVFEQMVGTGWTLVAASGDQGTTGACNNNLLVEYPASDLYVVAAGGTTLELDSNDNFSSEIGWVGGTAAGSCAGNAGGSTGGLSYLWPEPDYQSFLGFTNRSVPDLALNANVGQIVVYDGAFSHPGGTRIVSAMLAGFFAQENAYLLSLGNVCGGYGNTTCAPLGLANESIYYEGYNQVVTHFPFYDITSGCSSNDITAKYNITPYCAGTGYDQVTGWGSANMLQLAWAINYANGVAYGSPTTSFTGPAINTWYNSNQNVNWTIEDTFSNASKGTGIAGFSQGWDSIPTDSATQPSGATTASTDTFYTGPQFKNGKNGCLALASGQDCSGGVTQGCHTAHVRGWNNMGFTTGDTTYGPICYDTVDPTITASLSPATPSGGWYKGAVTVILNATDPGGSNASGIQFTGYTIGNQNCSPALTCNAYSSPFSFNTQGSTVIYYLTVDYAFNVGNGMISVNIDETAPVTTDTLSGTLSGTNYVSSATVTLSATDALSGVSSTHYFVDGGTNTIYTSPIVVSTPGTHKVSFYSVDVAGNQEATKSVTVTVVSPLTISPGSLTFASTAVGTTTGAQIITLTNASTSAISFTASTTLTGTGASSFIRTSTCTNPLPAGASCTNSIAFKPTTTGALTAVVTYTDNATGSPQTVSLTGTGAAAAASLTFSPSSLTFPSTAVGTAAPTQTITITNPGSSAISFTASTTITGSGAASFTKVASTCTNPLPAGASCTNTIQFKPTTSGALNAVVTYTDTAAASPQTVALTGTGGAGGSGLAFSPSSLTFASTAVGTTAPTQTITITNQSSSAVTFTASTTITGSGASSFSKIASTCTNPLAAGASCTNTIQFKPTSTGALSATVTYTDTAAGSPQTVSLTGTGGSAGLSFSPGSLSFPATAVGAIAPTQIITITNISTSPVTFTASTTITGAGAASFTKIASTCTNPLAAGARCTNTIQFKPTVTGILSATVTYTDTAAGSPQTVSLSGTGQ
jgi:hypothetical protein